MGSLGKGSYSKALLGNYRGPATIVVRAVEARIKPKQPKGPSTNANDTGPKDHRCYGSTAEIKGGYQK